jgi:hypothetical protein
MVKCCVFFEAGWFYFRCKRVKKHNKRFWLWSSGSWRHVCGYRRFGGMCVCKMEVNVFLPKNCTHIHDVTTQKTTVQIFTAVTASNLTWAKQRLKTGYFTVNTSYMIVTAVICKKKTKSSYPWLREEHGHNKDKICCKINGPSCTSLWLLSARMRHFDIRNVTASNQTLNSTKNHTADALMKLDRSLRDASECTEATNTVNTLK